MRKSNMRRYVWVLAGLAAATMVGACDSTGETYSSANPPMTLDTSVSSSAMTPSGPNPQAVADQEVTTGLEAPSVSAADQQFMVDAVGGGIAEVQEGRLAAKQAAVQETRRFGERMVKDHTALNHKLQRLAGSVNLMLPSQPPERETNLISQWETVSGLAFDHQYIRHMVQAHQQDIKLFEREARQADSPAVRDFAVRALPMLREHLKLAQAAEAKVGTAEHAASMMQGQPSMAPPAAQHHDNTPPATINQPPGGQ